MGMQGQIIAIGGGGFSSGSEPELDEYVLRQSGVAKPKIGFIATASGDADAYLLKFYSRFSALECIPSHLPLFQRTPNLADWVAMQDVIYVGGGNTKSMLAVWEAWGLAALLAKALDNGKVVAGVSAGAICWFEHGITDSNAGVLGPISGLGILPGSCCPHYSHEKDRKPAFEQLIRAGTVPNGIAIDDGAAMHFKNGVPYRVVVGSASTNVYEVIRTASGIATQPVSGFERVELG